MSEDLPLLDEVQELLNKERTLLALQVLEQQQDAVEWKSRYEKLFNEISTAHPAAQLIAHEIMNDDKEKNWNANGISSVLLDSHIFDFSHKKLGNEGVRQIFKSVHNLKRRGHNQSLILVLNSCQLSHDSIEEVVALISVPTVAAVDISNNDFGEVFKEKLFEALKFRKVPLQYLLLSHNQFQSSHFGKQLFSVASPSDIWGIAVTLADFDSEMNNTDAINGTTDRGKTKLTGGSKHPHHAKEFLQTLLDNAIQGSVIPKSTVRRQSSSGGAVPPLAVLGLTGAQLGRTTLTLLQQVLLVYADSLTDLDLSWALIGASGAELLAAALLTTSNGCQLVRLALTGNAIADFGCQCLSKVLVSNRSLTHLDVRSNDLHDASLRSLSECLSAGHKNNTLCLQRLDVRHNNLTVHGALTAEYEIQASGSATTLLWCDSSSRPLPRDRPEDLSPPYTTQAAPLRTRLSCHRETMPTVLYTIPAPAEVQRRSCTVLVEWSVRDRTSESLRPAAIHWGLRRPVDSGAGSDGDRQIGPDHTLTLSETPPSGGRWAGWQTCRAEVLWGAEEPAELLLVAYGASTGNSGSGYLELESSHLTATILPSSGDSHGLFTLVAGGLTADNSTIRTQDVRREHHRCVVTALPSGFTELQSLIWSGPPIEFCALSWELCLAATAAVARDPLTATRTATRPPTVGSHVPGLTYEWLVVVSPADGGDDIAVRGACSSPSLGATSATDLSWTWQGYQLTLAATLLPGDRIIIAASVVVSPEYRTDTNASAGASGCKVRIRDVRVWQDRETADERLRSWAGSAYVKADEMFCTHNDPSLVMHL